ncbi:hypothetical protein [Nisaea sp.]|uniref:hypothetical protein n=1 Tax=Nisaea sp. TaxID=2024842 RepID=UPI003B526FD5
MAGKSPWSVKGVSAEDREAAKIAARKAGMPIGVWLSEQIRHAASDKPAENRPAATEPEPAPAREDRSSSAARGPEGPRERHRIGRADPRFAFGRGQWSVAEEAIDEGMVATASAGYPWQFRGSPHAGVPAPAQPPMPANSGYPPPAPQMQHPVPAPASAPVAPGLSEAEGAALSKRVETLETQLRELKSKADAMEDRTLARFEPLLSKIETLTAEVEALNARPAALPAAQESSFSTAPIERAVMRLSERLGRVERLVLPGQGSGRGFFSRLFRRG